MTQPRVCAIMLVDGRPEMVARAIRSFEAQTYAQRELLLYDTGRPPYSLTRLYSNIAQILSTRKPTETIGGLRNIANTCACDADVIVHWDSDDWSAPERIAEQVALLTGATYLRTGELPLVVGYSDMLFFDTRTTEAWLYTGSPRYMLGTSLCYWRETWKRNPFPAKSQGEDTQWQMGLQSITVSSTTGEWPGLSTISPRMVCSIHGGNISSHVDQRSRQWRRVVEWDEYCKSVMV
jgi:hypothetical protein